MYLDDIYFTLCLFFCLNVYVLICYVVNHVFEAAGYNVIIARGAEFDKKKPTIIK